MPRVNPESSAGGMRIPGVYGWCKPSRNTADGIPLAAVNRVMPEGCSKFGQAHPRPGFATPVILMNAAAEFSDGAPDMGLELRANDSSLFRSRKALPALTAISVSLIRESRLSLFQRLIRLIPYITSEKNHLTPE